MGKKAAALALLLTFSVAYSYGTMGELGRRVNRGDRPLLTAKNTVKAKTFSLKSGYNFRGSQVIRPVQEDKTILLNTTFTYRLGGTTYSAPVHRKVAVNITDQNKLSSATLKINF
ncbi:MAG: hypothetical protein NVV59_15160 [Chitinophagaceae bacterium]|nr:hypothetical protein [Chitinophagaceae bacterium]